MASGLKTVHDLAEHVDDETDDLAPLENGELLDRESFHRRYAAMPEHVRAELIGGRVYIMASPLHQRHGQPHGELMAWLVIYKGQTPGTQALDNTSDALADEAEPQPDCLLRILPAFGGQTHDDQNGWIHGPPEFIFEVANSSGSIDLNAKRDDYEEHGVREYAVLLVGQRRVLWWTRHDNQFVPLPAGADGVFRSEVFPGLWLDAAALVAGETGRLLQILQSGLATPEHAAFVARLQARRNA